MGRRSRLRGRKQGLPGAQFWTLRRATALGVVSGIVALALWPFAGLYGWAMLRLFLLLAAFAALCGFSILVMTLYDIAHRPRRGSRIRPMRGFDTVVGITLLVMSWFELHDAIGLLPA